MCLWIQLFGEYLEGQGLSKSFISRVIIGVTPFRVLITLLITYLLSPLKPLQVGFARRLGGLPGVFGYSSSWGVEIQS